MAQSPVVNGTVSTEYRPSPLRIILSLSFNFAAVPGQLEFVIVIPPI